jgi:methionyl-tRNA formyltransferase
VRIVFMGTAEFGIPALQALHDRHEVVAAVTRPDAISGRGLRLRRSPVGIAGTTLGLPVLAPEKLTDPVFLKQLRAWEADLFFVVAFRLLPPDVFTLPPKGTVNLHGSLLPDYRGAAPIQRAIINGDAGTGLTTFYIGETVDTGDIIFSERVAIGPDETFGELRARMSDIGAELALRTVDAIAAGTAPRIRQPLIGGRPAPKLHKPDGCIDWKRDARSIHHQVRGMNPEPGAFTGWLKGPLKIHRTRIEDDISTGVPGRVAVASAKDGFSVYCGKGSLRILELQPPGKQSMDGAAFVRGYRVEAGSLLPRTGGCGR